MIDLDFTFPLTNQSDGEWSKAKRKKLDRSRQHWSTAKITTSQYENWEVMSLHKFAVSNIPVKEESLLAQVFVRLEPNIVNIVLQKLVAALWVVLDQVT